MTDRNAADRDRNYSEGIETINQLRLQGVSDIRLRCRASAKRAEAKVFILDLILFGSLALITAHSSYSWLTAVSTVKVNTKVATYLEPVT